MPPKDTDMEFYHPCEECVIRRKICVASGAYGACERCQKEHRHCSGMDVKDGKTTLSTSRFSMRVEEKNYFNIAAVEQAKIALLYASVYNPRLLRDSLLRKLLRHGAIEPDLRTVKSQGYITVPKWLATPDSYPPTSPASSSTVMLPITLYSLPAIQFLGFTQSSAPWYLHSLMAKLARMRHQDVPIPSDFLAKYFTKVILDKSVKTEGLDNGAIYEATGVHPDVYAPLLRPEHKNVVEMVPTIADWLVDIVATNARALLGLSITVKENLKKTSRARSVVRGLMSAEGSYEKMDHTAYIVRRVIVAKTPNGRVSVYRIQDFERYREQEMVLRRWEDLDDLESEVLVGGYPLFVFDEVPFEDVEKAARMYEGLLNEICGLDGKVRVEVEVPMPDVASLKSIGMEPGEVERIVDGCKRRQLLVQWFEMHRE